MFNIFRLLFKWMILCQAHHHLKSYTICYDDYPEGSMMRSFGDLHFDLFRMYQGIAEEL